LNALITHPVFKGISPAAPFAHYDQLVAQALSTTDSVFAKIESAGEKNLATAKQTTSGK